jgi:hypothetical protein
VSGPDEETKTQRVWESLKKAGLVEIKLDEFAKRIKDVKHATLGRLGELLELKNGIQERESVAHSLGFLKTLETTVREDVDLPKPERSGPSEE